MLMKTFNWGLPLAASTYAGEIDFGIRLIHWAMLAIFVLWGIFFTYLLIKYRRRDGVPAEREESHSVFKSLLPDILVLLFELVLIFTYALPVWSKIKMDVPPEGSSHRVDIIAEQFAWNAHYPGPDGKFGRRDPRLVHFSNPLGLDREDPAAADDITTANEIHMPLGQPTLIRLSSKDVIHSFFVPEFRIKQDAVPGMVIPVWVEPTTPGSFDIACAQLCGFAHSLMHGVVVVSEPEAYKQWASGQTQNVKKEEKAAESW
jgi:cytochrome c oxidase subunit 2